MVKLCLVLGSVFIVLLSFCNLSVSAGESNVVLPEGVYAQWDLSKAWSISSDKRERICINGLWKFRSAESEIPGAILSDSFEGDSGNDKPDEVDGWKLQLKEYEKCKNAT